MNRRTFLSHTTALIASPAIVRYSALMPIRSYDTFYSLNINLADEMLFECMRFNELQIMRTFGIPLHMIDLHHSPTHLTLAQLKNEANSAYEFA